MKRFTETQKWEDPWFRRLSPQMKLLWQWILDRCDNAGVIDPDIELASFQIGYQYPIDTLLEFGERVVKLPCGKWFIPKFIAFQYGQLSADCKAHKPIFLSLQKHSLNLDLNGYPKGINTLQEKEKEKEKETVKEESEIPKSNARLRRPTLSQAIEAASQIGITKEAAEFWWNTREASDWMKGSAGGGTMPVGSNWRSDMTASKGWATEQAAKAPTSTKPRTFID